MRIGQSLLGIVLWTNGLVDLICAAVLLVLPLLRIPVLGYSVFDAQGAFMAGGWGIATLALGVGRLWASPRPAFHPLMLLLGLFEGITLAVFCAISYFLARPPFVQVLPPLAVGVVFGFSYLVCAIQRIRESSS